MNELIVLVLVFLVYRLGVREGRREEAVRREPSLCAACGKRGATVNVAAFDRTRRCAPCANRERTLLALGAVFLFTLAGVSFLGAVLLPAGVLIKGRSSLHGEDLGVAFVGVLLGCLLVMMGLGLRRPKPALLPADEGQVRRVGL